MNAKLLSVSLSSKSRFMAINGAVGFGFVAIGRFTAYNGLIRRWWCEGPFTLVL